MAEKAELLALKQVKWKAYREKHKQEEERVLKEMVKLREEGKLDFGIVDLIITPSGVDMKSFCGTKAELRNAIENIYAKDGRDFDPKFRYPPYMLSHYGKDYMMQARGIYYRRTFSEAAVTCGRKVWIPSLSDICKSGPNSRELEIRAENFAARSRDNERWCKSEYTWEADAWFNVFGSMRDDPCLEVDKHEYTTLLADTDPVTCHLTGSSTMVSRTPDASFGLATFSDRDASLACWTSDLQRDRLERLMLHPNYGLVSDPKCADIGLSFPFMVYEAKSWSGDCRQARRQACSGAAVYLDMLDDLARRPGQVDSARPYQTKTSHQYQVFVLTSFGAYWHLLVGHRRPRQQAEHADKQGMSDTVYVFQNVWSGHVVDDLRARELLLLIDQVHMWAVTEFRSFVLDHLRPWHELCDKNYLLEWDSKYDVPEQKKRYRGNCEKDELRVPSRIAKMQESGRRLFQARAKASLDEANQYRRQVTGKALYHDDDKFKFFCTKDGCDSTESSEAVLLEHYRTTHKADDRELAWMRRSNEYCIAKLEIKERQKRGVMATGVRWLGPPELYPFMEPESGDEDIWMANPAKRRKLSTPRGHEPSSSLSSEGP